MNQKLRQPGELSKTPVSTEIVASPASADGLRTVPVSGLSLSTQTAAAAPSTLGLLRALKRRLTLALGAGVLAALVFGIAAYFLVPQAKFKAQAVLHVKAQPPQVMFRTVDTQNMNGGDEYNRYQKTQMAWVKSRLVLNAALSQKGSGGIPVKQFKMIREKEPDAVRWLQENIDVHFEPGSELLNICLSGDYPQEVSDLVNAVKNAYLEEVVNVDQKHRSEHLDTLRKLKENYANTLKSERQTLKKLAEQAGSDDRQTLALKQQFAMEHLDHVKKELLEIQSQKRKAQAELRQQQQQLENVQETAPASIPEAELSQAIEQDPSVAELRNQLAMTQSKLDLATARARRVARNLSSEPGLRYLRDQVEMLRKSLAKERGAARVAVRKQLENQDTGKKEGHGGQLQQQIALLEDLEQRVSAQIDQLNASSRRLNLDTLDLQSIQDDLLQSQESAAKIGAEVEALTVEIQAPPRVQWLEDAVIPLTKDDKKQILMICLIALGSFFSGLFGVAFLELQSQKVDTADEVVTGLGLSIVGALPLVPTKTRRSGLVEAGGKDRYWHNLMLESIDATRTMLLSAARASGHRVVMIGSAESGEGKTTLSSHLATSLARTGLKTLLIDADLRCPTINRLFDLPPEPGLSELLRGEARLDDIIAPTAVEELKVITGGRFDQATIRNVAQGGLGAIFSELKERFDFVIIDSSPLLPVADGLMIAQQADAVLFSILRDVSRKTKVFAAYQRLSTLGVPILGAVVTGTYGGAYGYGYYTGQPYVYPAKGRKGATSSSSERRS
jgi:capsular exopolysaccharide synthesis family protein